MTSTPGQTAVADDTTTADAALAQLRAGTTLVWQGDFHNGRQLLKALDRRLEKRASRRGRGAAGQETAGEVFLRQRAERARRAEILGRVVVDVDVRDGDAGGDGPQWSLDLRRAPEVAGACAHAWGPADPATGPRRVPLAALQGVLSAWQWHLRGVAVPTLGEDAEGAPERVYPDYGVFSPTRSEYVDLVDAVAAEQLREGASVLELGTGTGVLAAVLVRRGAGQVTATDVNPRAVTCARRNLDRLGAGERCTVVEADLWPVDPVDPDAPAVADVVVFNPPWLPGTPTSELELGIYDAESDALRRFLAQLTDHLTEGGEGWLVLSGLAEQLGLREPGDLDRWISEGGLQVLGRADTAPHHPKAQGARGRAGKGRGGKGQVPDPLQEARARETTTLWRLGRA